MKPFETEVHFILWQNARPQYGYCTKTAYVAAECRLRRGRYAVRQSVKREKKRLLRSLLLKRRERLLALQRAIDLLMHFI